MMADERILSQAELRNRINCVAGRWELAPEAREDILASHHDQAARIKALEADQSKREAENARLRRALESLMDIQNGPPLVRDTEAWNEAMAEAGQALGEKGGA